MKQLIMLLFFGTLISACDQVNQEALNNYEQSYEQFRKQQEKHKAYQFRINSSSVMTERRSSTTYLVQDKKVVGRMFETYDMRAQKTVEYWVEKGEEVSKHDLGVAPITLDDIYQEAPELLKKNTTENNVYFDTDSNGIVTSVGYVPKNCADDCFRGYNIDNFKWIDDLQKALNNLAIDTSVNAGPDLSLMNQYQESLEYFNEQKAQHKGYQFVLSFSSAEGYFGYKTHFWVEDGKLIKRAFTGYKYDVDEQKQIALAHWTEESDELGSHEEGHPPVTLEQIYAKAPELLEVDPQDHRLYLKTGHDGILSLVGYFPTNCADDCFEGYNIDEFKWID